MKEIFVGFLLIVSANIALANADQYAEKQTCTLTFKKKIFNRSVESSVLLNQVTNKLASHSFGIQSSSGETAVIKLVQRGDAYDMSIEGSSKAMKKTGLEEGKVYSAGPMFLNGLKYKVFNSSKIKMSCQVLKL